MLPGNKYKYVMTFLKLIYMCACNKYSVNILGIVMLPSM